MDKRMTYRELIQTLLSRYVEEDVTDEAVEVQLLCDTQRDHYQWMNVGWKGMKRVYSCFIHIDIKDGKIWLQQNWTEEDPAAALVEMGVLREDIVLGLQPPYKRPYMDYRVA